MEVHTLQSIIYGGTKNVTVVGIVLLESSRVSDPWNSIPFNPLPRELNCVSIVGIEHLESSRVGDPWNSISFSTLPMGELNCVDGRMENRSWRDSRPPRRL